MKYKDVIPPNSKWHMENNEKNCEICQLIMDEQYVFV